MNLLRFTLLTEGSADRALLPLIEWAIRQQRPLDRFEPEWADFGYRRSPPKSLTERVKLAIEEYPCDLLFVHRDADRAGRSSRVKEITTALGGAQGFPAVCVVPVRMLEAWFLFDEAAIRRAAGNPNGRTPLSLPNPREIEGLSDPKSLLASITETAAERRGPRRRQLDLRPAVHLIANYIDDFSPLRGLPAFRAFEADLQDALSQLP
jgi:hypothetical protein